ncbi:PAS domain-containing protein [bacterium]|nr:PAS domain-containing protein [bacterium]
MKFSLPKRFSQLQLHSREVVVLFCILIVVIIFSGIFELRGTRREIEDLLENEAATLMEAIVLSGANAIDAFDTIEQLMEEKLFAVAEMVDHMDQEKLLTVSLLDSIAAKNQVFRIHVRDTAGNLFLSNSTLPGHTGHSAAPVSSLLQPLLSGETDRYAIGFRDAAAGNEQRFAVALHRTRGGGIIVNVDASEMLAFRRSVGIGRLMQDIADNKNIDYLVLQDWDGLLLASRGVDRMTTVASDSFLQAAYYQTGISARMVTNDSSRVYEFVQPFIPSGDTVGVFRLGMNTDALQQANQRIQRRFWVMSLVLALVFLLVAGFLVISQKYQAVNVAYQRLQTYSKNILEHMGDAVIAIDRQHRIILFNQAARRLFQAPSGEILNRTAELLDGFSLTPLYNALENGRTIFDEEMNAVINQRHLVLLISTSVLLDPDGQVDSAFAVIKDLTEKRILEARVQRQEKLTAMGQLASGVAHEIRNPLNAIGMISQRLAVEFKPTEDDAEYRDLTRTVVSEVRRINDIIQQFLHFARPPKLNLIPGDLNDTVKATVLLVSAQAEAKNCRIQTDFQKLPTIAFDPNQMKQAFLNLLQNSIEAVDEQGDIQISTAVKKRDIQIVITDNGNGIPPEKQSKIFNLYFTTKPTGTGLGLSFVHQVISQHNGQIEVDSAPGQGTTFTIFLPR